MGAMGALRVYSTYKKKKKKKKGYFSLFLLTKSDLSLLPFVLSFHFKR